MFRKKKKYLTVSLGPGLAVRFLCSVCCTEPVLSSLTSLGARVRPTFHGFRGLDELSHRAGDALGESSQLVLEFRARFLKNLTDEDKQVRKTVATARESPL